MTLEQKFEDAQVRVRKLTTRPSNEDLLELYALFKQAKDGDNNTKKPGMFDLKEQYKWKKWKALKGTAADTAMEQYINLVDKLLGV